MVFILMMYLDYLSATYNPGDLYAGAFVMDIVLLKIILRIGKGDI